MAGAARVVCALLLVWLREGLPAEAHDIGRTQVRASVDEAGRFQIDVDVDAESLLTKLQMLAGEDPTEAVPAADRERRIRKLRETLLGQVHLSFDGVPVSPDVSLVAPSPGAVTRTGEPAPGIVRIQGAVPAKARAFVWSYGLVFGSYSLTVTQAGVPTPQVVWLDGRQASPPVALRFERPAPVTAVATRYLALGFAQVFPYGLDHVLFVLGVFFPSTRLRPVLLQLTTFTLAHSIALGLSVYGLISLPAYILDPLIALSIAYVAIENLLTSELKPWRIALVFSCGLPHGLRFAGDLRGVGLPRAEFLPALLAFNLGVEIAQAAVIGAAFLALACWRRNAPVYRRRIVVPASMVLALVGLLWTVERLAA